MWWNGGFGEKRPWGTRRLQIRRAPWRASGGSTGGTLASKERPEARARARACVVPPSARVGVGVVAAAFESTRANDVAGAKRALSSTRKITSRAQTLAPSLAGATVTGARRARPRGRRAWTRCCASSPSASGHARVSRSNLAFVGRRPRSRCSLGRPRRSSPSRELHPPLRVRLEGSPRR